MAYEMVTAGLFMREITAIQAQRKNPQRVNLYLDGEFAFGLSRLVAGWLSIGQKLSDEKIAQLQANDLKEVAYQRALLFLSYRARSIDEIRKYLRKHDIPADVTAMTLERLKGNGLANDNDFAEAWVENRNTFRPRSRRVLAMELRQKGIQDDVIQQVLEDNVPEEDLAFQAGSKKARQLASLDWQEFRQKVGSFLARRGFPYSIISPTVQNLWKEYGGDQKNLNNEENL